MKSTCKKLVTDINRNKDLEVTIPKYVELMKSQCNFYSAAKLCLNLYTVREMLEDADNNLAFKEDYIKIADLLDKSLCDGCPVEDADITNVDNVRNNVEYKMRILTSYADAFEIFEYILNRLEAGVKGTSKKVDHELLSDKMFQYVFSENDTVVINSKLQILMAQLPVRMTKKKFYDVIANTLSIYKGGETTSVDEFADMLRTAVLMSKPDGFETEYPELYDIYCRLEEADYKAMDEACFDRLCMDLNHGAEYITQQVSFYMLFQEVINDTYTILLTSDAKACNNEFNSYNSALEIIETCIKYFSEDAAEQLMSSFMNMEGIQENVYENVMILETVLDDVVLKAKDYDDEIKRQIDSLKTVEKLVSSSLFVNLNKSLQNTTGIADNDYIDKLKTKLTDEFAEYFNDKDILVVRSMMSKILATMPIFLNSQQEIKNYFDYVLQNCKNDSELTACNKLICELIEDDDM